MIDVPVRVKDSLRDGRLLKRYSFIVYTSGGTEDFTIDNDSLVYESVKFDERMCSGDTIKFGLCEGSSLEFQYFDHPNINGRRLQSFIDVQYIDSDGDKKWHTIPMGYFTVKKCSRQASTGIQKVTAYNKLQSDYLDNKINNQIISMASEAIVGAPNETNVGMILDQLMSDYTITRPRVIPSGSFEYITQPTHSSSYSTINGLYLHWLEVTCRFTPDDYSLDNIYRIVVNTGPLYTENKKLIPSQYKDTVFFYGNVSGTLEQWFDSDGAYENNGISSFSILEAGVSPYYAQIITTINTNKDSYQRISDWATNVKSYGLEFVYIGLFVVDGSQTHTWTQAEKDEAIANIQTLLEPLNTRYWFVQESGQSEIEKTKITAAEALTLGDVTLRELQSASYELTCQYGQLSRTTDYFEGRDLNHSWLYPRESLYPDNALYPDGGATSGDKSSYSKLWTDEQGRLNFRYLIITYKGLDQNNVPTTYTLQKTVNAEGTTDYVMDDNWLFKNLIWTQQQVEDYADAMATKMQDVSWIPFEMWAAGLPYIETGDEIEITVGENTYTSYILQRQLSGIHNLQDTYINGTLDVF